MVSRRLVEADKKEKDGDKDRGIVGDRDNTGDKKDVNCGDPRRDRVIFIDLRLFSDLQPFFVEYLQFFAEEEPVAAIC